MSGPLDAAYVETGNGGFRAGALTRGPWDPGHQHAGPPSALVCREIERAALPRGLTHLGRLTGNLWRPVPIGEVSVEVHEDYIGRNAGHYRASLLAAGKEVARFTALMQREDAVPVPEGTPGHPLPDAPRRPEDCPVCAMPFGGEGPAYPDLIETRLVSGRFFQGPCTVWFRLRHPIIDGEEPSAYERVAVAADSGNGIGAALDFGRYVFLNADLTVNLLRRPVGEWIALEARTMLGGNGCGLAESTLYDTAGRIGRATQSLSVRARG